MSSKTYTFSFSKTYLIYLLDVFKKSWKTRNCTCWKTRNQHAEDRPKNVCWVASFDVQSLFTNIPLNIYLFKIKSRNNRKICDICSRLTIKTPTRRHWYRSFVFIVEDEHFSKLVFSSVSIVNYEQVNTYWNSPARNYWIIECMCWKLI